MSKNVETIENVSIGKGLLGPRGESDGKFKGGGGNVEGGGSNDARWRRNCGSRRCVSADKGEVSEVEMTFGVSKNLLGEIPESCWWKVVEKHLERMEEPFSNRLEVIELGFFSLFDLGIALGSMRPRPSLRRIKGSRLRGLVRISAMFSSEETFSIEMFPFWTLSEWKDDETGISSGLCYVTKACYIPKNACWQLFGRGNIRLRCGNGLGDSLLREPRCEATSHECAHTACAFATDIVSRMIEVSGFAAALAVLVIGASQSRQHESRKSPNAELFDVDFGRISIVTVNT
ncbi:hypothetical protein Tco_0162264 [Tanacetum coccineum]